MKLNFGCGDKIKKGYINVDILKGKGIDKSFDFNIFPYPFEANTFDYVFARNIMEHLIDVEKVMDELWRICKPNATIEIIVPYYNHRVAHNSFQHKHYPNMRAFENLCDYETTTKLKPENKFELIEVKRIAGSIKSKLPMFVLNFFDKFLHSIFIEINAKIRVLKNDN